MERRPVAKPWLIPMSGTLGDSNTNPCVCFHASHDSIWLQHYSWRSKRNHLFANQIAHDMRPCRSNAYDGQEEYWIVAKEVAQRVEETSWEEHHTKKSKAPDICVLLMFHSHRLAMPGWDRPHVPFPEQDGSRGSFWKPNRDEKERNTKLEDPKHDKYAQDRVPKKREHEQNNSGWTPVIGKTNQ